MEKDNKKLLSYITLIFVVCVAFILLMTLLVGMNLAASIFMAVGLFNLILMIGSIVMTKQDSKLPVLFANVVSCEEKKEESGEDSVSSYYYEVTYEVPWNGEYKEVVTVSEKKYKEGQQVKVLYNAKSNSIITYADHMEIKSDKNNKKLGILIAVFFIIGIVIQLVTVLGKDAPEGFYMNVTMLCCGLFILAFGILVLVGQISRAKAKDSYHQVEGTLTEFFERYENNAESSGAQYYPVYEYVFNGEACRHISTTSKSRRHKVGNTYSLFISDDGDVYEKGENKGQWGTSIILLGMAAIMLAASIGGLIQMFSK